MPRTKGQNTSVVLRARGGSITKVDGTKNGKRHRAVNLSPLIDFDASISRTGSNVTGCVRSPAIPLNLKSALGVFSKEVCVITDGPIFDML